VKIQAKDIILVPIDKIIPNEKNRNQHTPSQIERLKQIIEYQGFRIPVIISNRSGRLVAGHGRILAAKQLGMKFVPAIYQDFESDEQEYTAGISDNSIAAWAELDLTSINLDIGDLGPFDIDLLGIDSFTVDMAEKEGLTDEDEVPEINQSEARTKFGELYQLGEHRLLCGDSTDSASVARLMNGEKADMVFTDPPYGMNLDTDYSKMHDGGKTYKPVHGDDKPFDPSHLLEMAKEVFLWGADYYCQSLPRGGGWLVWNKLYSSKYEGTETVKTIGNGFELCWSKIPHQRVIRACLWHGSIYNEGKDEERKPGTSVVIRHHPNQKPIKLFSDMLEEYSEQNWVIFDGYLGSGSTLIACEKTNRKCYGSEIDPHYCDVILTRWAKYTGKDPVREDGKKWSELKK
jgi:DNA modification methylase